MDYFPNVSKPEVENRDYNLIFLTQVIVISTKIGTGYTVAQSRREIIFWTLPEWEGHITNLPPDVKGRMEFIVSSREWSILKDFFLYPIEILSFSLRLIEISM